MTYLIPGGATVIEIGCGTGQLLNELKPAKGVGIDISLSMVERARQNYPDLIFEQGDALDPSIYQNINGTFDYIIISDSLGLMSDCQLLFENINLICSKETRLIIAHYGYAWEPVLKIAELLGLKMPQPVQNWLTAGDIDNLLGLSQFDVVSHEWSQLMPIRMFGFGKIINRFFGSLPLIQALCLRNYTIARSIKNNEVVGLSASIIIPCRNERGNIETAVKRIPKLCDDIELIFVEGHSSDSTYAECFRVQKAYPKKKIKVIRQTGEGKGDAVRSGFKLAGGDVLFILDADLTVPPETLPQFYNAIASGKGEYIHGSRLVYPMEEESMRFLNLVANWVFARVFSYLLNQRITDTLCGTKVLTKAHYNKIAENRNYFGILDPFGDFDLLFGATKLNLKILEIPIRYARRTYGTTQISRFKHGWLLLRMALKAYLKIKAI